MNILYRLMILLSFAVMITLNLPVRAQDTEGVSGTTPIVDRGAVAPLPVPDSATPDELSVDETPGDEVRSLPDADLPENDDEMAKNRDSMAENPADVEPQAGPIFLDGRPQKPWWRFW